MSSYIVRRFINIAVTMFFVATIVFVVMNIVPGDPTGMILGDEASPQAMAELRAHLGLDQPMGVRLLSWYGGLLRGDLGQSMFYQRGVLEIILARIEPTVFLTFMALVIAATVGVLLGTVAGLRPGSAADLATMVVALLGISIPNFWLGLNLMLVFSLYLGWLPTAGYQSIATVGVEGLRYLILPAIALGMSHAGIIARMTRANIVEVMHEDYVRTARAKGLLERVITAKHALRNAMIPVASTIGVSMALMIGGSVIVEAVFAIPGIGSVVMHSIMSRDFPVVQGVLLLVALFTALVNLAVDLMYAVLDPRIRYV